MWVLFAITDNLFLAGFEAGEGFPKLSLFKNSGGMRWIELVFLFYSFGKVIWVI